MVHQNPVSVDEPEYYSVRNLVLSPTRRNHTPTDRRSGRKIGTMETLSTTYLFGLTPTGMGTGPQSDLEETLGAPLSSLSRPKLRVRHFSLGLYGNSNL